MTEKQQMRDPKLPFLPLGSVVILRGSVKKLLIVSRGSIVEDVFYDYGAFMYPEGMIDSKVAYFNHDNILRVVHVGYADDDDALVVEILNDAYAEFQERRENEPKPLAPVPSAPPAAEVEDMFASVRDLADEDE
ncbi:DUF4176 domain-containing protein [Leifsonia xyli]|uniref:DUF4176 domain-containing protein n=1 Tax=Leifsonia xyli TaxID=1575 RepID=UPI003D66D428